MIRRICIIIILFAVLVTVGYKIISSNGRIRKNVSFQARLLTPADILPCDSVRIALSLMNKGGICNYVSVLNRFNRNKKKDVRVWAYIEKKDDSGKWQKLSHQGTDCPESITKPWEVSPFYQLFLCDKNTGTYRFTFTLEVEPANQTTHNPQIALQALPVIITVKSPVILELKEKADVSAGRHMQLRDLLDIRLRNVSTKPVAVSHRFTYKSDNSNRDASAVLILELRGYQPAWTVNMWRSAITFSSRDIFTLIPGSSVNLLAGKGLAQGTITPFEHPVQNTISLAAHINLQIISDGDKRIDKEAALQSDSIMLDFYRFDERNREFSIFGAPVNRYSRVQFRYTPEDGESFFRISGKSGVSPDRPFLKVSTDMSDASFGIDGLERWPLTLCDRNLTIEGFLTNSIIDVWPNPRGKGCGILKKPVISAGTFKLPRPSYYNADKRFSKQRIETDLHLSSDLSTADTKESPVITSTLTNRSEIQGYLIYRPMIRPNNQVPGCYYEARLKDETTWRWLKKGRPSSCHLGVITASTISPYDTLFLVPGAHITFKEDIASFSEIDRKGVYVFRVHYAYIGNLSERKKTAPIQSTLDSLAGTPGFDIVSSPVEIRVTDIYQPVKRVVR